MIEPNKILILGAGEGQIPLIKRAKSSGWFVIVVSPKGDYPGFAIADKCCYADISDKETVLRIALTEKIEAIATDQTDISTPVVQYVCEQMDLPHIKCRDIRNFQQKSLMRNICLEQRIPTIPYKLITSLEEAEMFLMSMAPNPCIIKPIDSQGSRGVQKVNDVAELRMKWNGTLMYSKLKLAIIELFIDGQEIEVDSVVKDGEVLGTLIGNVYNFQLSDTFSSYERIYPTDYDTTTQSLIKEVNNKTIRALGMVTGWTHGEYIVTESKKVFLIEIGARGGGNYIGSDIVRIMLGKATDEMAFLTAIGNESFFYDIFLRDKHCAYKCFYLPEGTISSVEIDNSLLNEPYLVTHNLHSLREGIIIHSNTDKTSRYTVVLAADTREQLLNILESIPKRIKIKVQTENGIKGCIWN